MRIPCSETMRSAKELYVSATGSSSRRSRSRGISRDSRRMRSRRRSPSSPAALRVKVKPRIDDGLRSGWFARSQSTRMDMVSVLPDPAPATTRRGRRGASTTRTCSGVGVFVASTIAWICRAPRFIAQSFATSLHHLVAALARRAQPIEGTEQARRLRGACLKVGSTRVRHDRTKLGVPFLQGLALQG